MASSAARSSSMVLSPPAPRPRMALPKALPSNGAAAARPAVAISRTHSSHAASTGSRGPDRVAAARRSRGPAAHTVLYPKASRVNTMTKMATVSTMPITAR